jgi:NTE family protein
MDWSFFRRLIPGLIETEPKPPAVVGLALGGGAVRGAAHLGVLSVLEREHVPIGVVTGTSVGALVGAGVAAGVGAGDMLKAFSKASWASIAFPSWTSKLSLLEADPLGALMERVTNAETFDDLGLPFAAVACDLLTGTSFVMTEGSLRQALIASSAIPGLFEPVRREGVMLVDGGLVDNLPIDVASDLGADYVIAVDVMPPLDGSYEPKDLRDVLLLSWNIVQRASEFGRERAGIVITPQVATVPLSDFSKVHDAYEAGVVAAEAALPTLLADLGMTPSAAAESGGVPVSPTH